MPASTPHAPPLFSHCQLAPWHIASLEFQADPQPMDLGDVRITERRLWNALAALPSPAERGRYFHDYISVKFSLNAWNDPDLPDSARTALRHSYVHCLRHWGVDSNGPAGAALKAWVESRFGLRPTYHGGCLVHDVAARARYAHDRMIGAARTMSLAQQLDLLYTFAQDELQRRHPGQRWLTLYRGTHDTQEYSVRSAPPATGAIGAAPPPGKSIVEFNNLSSFTADREIAWEFGSAVWAVRVPLSKIFCFSGLLPPSYLQGESEFMVLGGIYEVAPLRG